MVKIVANEVLVVC